MSNFRRIAFVLNMTVATIALSAVTAQASGIPLARSASVLAQLSQNDTQQNGVNETAPPAPSDAPLETIPTAPGTGTTLPDPLDATPTDPTPSSGSSALDPGETAPPAPTAPDPTINNGVVPDRIPAPIPPYNNVPNNNVPDPRQNVPNRSVDTPPNSLLPDQNAPNRNAVY